jgi:hypothetical protein
VVKEVKVVKVVKVQVKVQVQKSKTATSGPNLGPPKPPPCQNDRPDPKINFARPRLRGAQIWA